MRRSLGKGFHDTLLPAWREVMGLEDVDSAGCSMFNQSDSESRLLEPLDVGDSDGLSIHWGCAEGSGPVQEGKGMLSSDAPCAAAAVCMSWRVHYILVKMLLARLVVGNLCR